MAAKTERVMAWRKFEHAHAEYQRLLHIEGAREWLGRVRQFLSTFERAGPRDGEVPEELHRPGPEAGSCELNDGEPGSGWAKG